MSGDRSAGQIRQVDPHCPHRMEQQDQISFFGAPRLTRTRMILALAVALVSDFLQVALVPFEAAFIQQFIDVAAMVLTTLILGFHWLLLPTFAFEFIPFVDMAPT